MRVVLRVALLTSCAGAFELNTVRLQRRAAGAVEASSVTMGMPDELHDTPDVPELPEECGPYLTIKGKSINAFGALYGLQSVLLLGPLWWAALTLCEKVCEATGWDEDRVFHDGIGKAWSWLNMAVGGCSPAEVTGKDNLPAPGLPALYVSNHASWFDIPLVAQTIPNSFKFIAADELRDLPLVGQQLTDGKHVLIDRSSRRGQLKSFKESVGYLKKGVGIFAFPEGTRSRNGRLMPFKGGVFSMAMKAGVPIVPISVVGTFETYPPAAALPILPNGENLRVHIHPQVHLEDRTEAELEQLTRDAILSALPPENQPLPTAEPALEREVPAAAKVGTPA